MRAALLLLVWLLCTPVAFAAFDDSKVWFEDLSEAVRTDTQTDLLLAGHYAFLIDGQFGRGTFDAITAFQRSQGKPDTGVLTVPELRVLNALAAKVNTDWGMDLVTDRDAAVELILPTRLLTERQATESGTSYFSRDSEFSLETMHKPLSEVSFEDLFAELVAPDPERQVTYQNFGDERFVVSGRIGAYSYYTMFEKAGSEAIGYSLAWGSAYETQGAITSVFLASHFTPLSLVPPGDEMKTETGGETASRGAFVLPEDRPDVLVLNADITATTPDEFITALAARPEARILVLNSPGGGVDSALQMAREIRSRGMSTYVAPDMGCYSACAYMFFAGVDRRADGELGVHQISAEIADLVLAQTTLGDLLDALEEFGVAQPVISHMLRTPPEEMYVFTPQQVAEYGINRGAPIAVTVTIDQPIDEPAQPADGAVTAFVQLASQQSAAEAQRSLAYATDRWASVLGEAKPEIETADLGSAGKVYRIRVPAPSIERANTICAAIKSDGGGCYVTRAMP